MVRAQDIFLVVSRLILRTAWLQQSLRESLQTIISLLEHKNEPVGCSAMRVLSKMLDNGALLTNSQVTANLNNPRWTPTRHPFSSSKSSGLSGGQRIRYIRLRYRTALKGSPSM